MRYSQQAYDSDSGVMAFIAPGQVLRIEAPKAGAPRATGYLLMVHPDFLWGSLLAQKIKRYAYFGYAIHEALHLADREESIITGLMQHIEAECSANIDTFSADVILAQLELVLTYAERFYQRQFITRKISGHQLLTRFEALLDTHLADQAIAESGLPTVHALAEALAVSPDYLSGMLKTLTGCGAQAHIHDRLIDRAKEKLSTTSLSVSEIAYALGFEHPQSFSKLFKNKTELTPLAFRACFN